MDGRKHKWRSACVGIVAQMRPHLIAQRPHHVSRSTWCPTTLLYTDGEKVARGEHLAHNMSTPARGNMSESSSGWHGNPLIMHLMSTSISSVHALRILFAAFLGPDVLREVGLTLDHKPHRLDV